MASDAVIYLSWQRPVPGREAQAMELFNFNMEYYASLQEAGVIDSFEPVFLFSHAAQEGFILIRGESAKIYELLRDSKFQASIVRGEIVLEKFTVVPGTIGPGMMKEFEAWGTELARIDPEFAKAWKKVEQQKLHDNESRINKQA